MLHPFSIEPILATEDTFRLKIEHKFTSPALTIGKSAVNLLFFVTIVLLVLVSVQLSYELSRHEARIRRLAEEVALLEERTRELRSREEDR